MTNTSASKTGTSPAKRKVGRPAGTRGTGRPKNQGTTVGRDMLIDKTCELLKTTQPSEITRAMVARETGVDPSLIRYYFSNRSTLLTAAARRVSERYQEMLDAAAARSDGSARSQLSERIRALVELLATYPYFHRLFVEEIMGSDSEDARAVFEAITARGSTSYDAIIKNGVDSGAFRQVDTAMLFAAIIGMSEFFKPGTRVIEQARGHSVPEEDLRESYARFICDLVIDGIGTRDEVRPQGRKPSVRLP
jgi:TetR/AcrR family transcriptional regulator